MQDIFLKIIEKADMFNGNMAFSTWVFTVAHNMVKNEYRRLRVREIFSRQTEMRMPASVLTEVETEIDRQEFRRSLFEALARLDIKKRSTFLLRFQENFSIKEISDILGCSEGTVKSRLFYTCRLLSRQLQAYSPKNQSG